MRTESSTHSLVHTSRVRRCSEYFNRRSRPWNECDSPRCDTCGGCGSGRNGKLFDNTLPFLPHDYVQPFRLLQHASSNRQNVFSLFRRVTAQISTTVVLIKQRPIVVRPQCGGQIADKSIFFSLFGCGAVQCVLVYSTHAFGLMHIFIWFLSKNSDGNIMTHEVDSGYRIFFVLYVYGRQDKPMSCILSPLTRRWQVRWAFEINYVKSYTTR